MMNVDFGFGRCRCWYTVVVTVVVDFRFCCCQVTVCAVVDNLCHRYCCYFCCCLQVDIVVVFEVDIDVVFEGCLERAECFPNKTGGIPTT